METLSAPRPAPAPIGTRPSNKCTGAEGVSGPSAHRLQLNRQTKIGKHAQSSNPQHPHPPFVTCQSAQRHDTTTCALRIPQCQSAKPWAFQTPLVRIGKEDRKMALIFKDMLTTVHTNCGMPLYKDAITHVPTHAPPLVLCTMPKRGSRCEPQLWMPKAQFKSMEEASPAVETTPLTGSCRKRTSDQAQGSTSAGPQRPAQYSLIFTLHVRMNSSIGA